MRMKPLDIAFKLTGVGIPPCEVSEPLTINHGLALAGLLADRYSGMGALEGEWAYNRTFALEGVFALDGWGCERTYIEFEYLLGAGRIFINDESAGEFAGGCCAMDITGCVRTGANLLRIEFDPAAERGAIGGIKLRGCWSLHLRGLALECSPAGISASVKVSAHAAGRYRFSYAVSRGDVAVGTYEFDEMLRARADTLTHELPVDAPGEYRLDAPDMYRVKLSVLRAGQSCDERVGFVAGESSDEERPTVALGGAMHGQAALDMLMEAGARRFIADSDAYLPEKFLRAADERGAEVVAAQMDGREAHACFRKSSRAVNTEEFRGMRLFGDEARLIPEIAFRALGGGKLLDDTASDEFGGVRLSDLPRLSRIVRYLQALKLARAADAARAEGGALGVDIGRGEMAISCDLFDGDEPRPAYYALKAAWRAQGVYALVASVTFDAGAQVSVPVYAWGEGIVRVRAELYDAAGRALSRAEFESGGRGLRRVGEVMFTLGSECAAYLMRITGICTTGYVVRDYPLCVRGEYGLSALSALDTARIKRVSGEYENMDVCIAFGVCRADGGGALLPGERKELCAAQGINAHVYGELSEGI